MSLINLVHLLLKNFENLCKSQRGCHILNSVLAENRSRPTINYFFRYFRVNFPSVNNYLDRWALQTESFNQITGPENADVSFLFFSRQQGPREIHSSSSKGYFRK